MLTGLGSNCCGKWGGERLNGTGSKIVLTSEEFASPDTFGRSIAKHFAAKKKQTKSHPVAGSSGFLEPFSEKALIKSRLFRLPDVGTFSTLQDSRAI